MLKDNKMVQAACEGNKPSLGLIILMPFLFTFTLSIGNVISTILGEILFRSLGEPLSQIATQYLNYIISFALAGGVIFWVVCKVQKKSWKSLGLFREKAVFYYLKGAGIAVLGIIAMMSILQFKGEIMIQPTALNREGALWGILLMICVAWVIQGAAEEVFLRGFMFQAITSRYGVYKGIIVPAMVFALLHLGNAGINMISMLNILLCGLALVLLVLKDENLWGAFGFHAAWNLLQGNVFGVSVSGNAMDISLFKVINQTDTLWSGGNFGLEGSLLTTIFFVLMSLFLILQLRKVQK